MATSDVFGADLHEGDVLVEHMPDGSDAPHLIDHFAAYPGRFIARDGDGGARLVFCADGWRCTAGDGEHFHIQAEEG